MGTVKGPTESSLIQRLLANNRAWVDGRLAEDPDYFRKLAEGQAPSIALFGCSDSRKCVNTILGTRPGDLFIHRNIGNQVDPSDPNAQAVLEFALLHLGVRHVVVAGHTRCGGMDAALAGYDQGMVGGWLRAARGLVARNARELNAIVDPKARADRLSELNVVAQVANVLRSTPYRRARESGDAPEVHGWLFGLETGYIREVELPLDQWKREKLV